MITHGDLQCALHPQEALVECGRIFTVKREEFHSALAAAHKVELPVLDPIDDRCADRCGGFAIEAEIRAGIVRGHHRRIGAARKDRQDIDVLVLQLALERFAEAS